MRKRDELSDPKSCLNKAGDDEFIFTLLGRDQDAPAAIRFWISRRIARGKNQPTDAKMIEALECARRMEDERVQQEAKP